MMECDACGDALSIEEFDFNAIYLGDPVNEEFSLCDRCMAIRNEGGNPWDDIDQDEELLE